MAQRNWARPVLVRLVHARRMLLTLALLGGCAPLLVHNAAAQDLNAAQPAAPAASAAPVAQTDSVPRAPRLLLRPPTEAAVAWRGMLVTEGGAVGQGPSIGPYMAANAGGALLAVLTHATLNEGVQSLRQSRAQAEADEVLQPYLPALQAWPAASLWQAVLEQAPADLGLAEAGAGSAPAATLTLRPSFTLSQDETVLIADVALRFEDGGAAAAPVERLVRVVSSPLPGNDARAHWLPNEAQLLKQTAAALVAHAAQVGYRHISAPATDVPARTHRYLRGKLEGAERGQLVHAECGRAVLLTLRGHLLSVPQAQTGQTPCSRSSSL